MPDISVEDVKTAVGELRSTVEKYGKDSAETKEMSVKVEKTLEDHETKSAEIVATQVAAEKKTLELEDQIKELELEVINSQKSGISYKELPEYKALVKMVQFGSDSLESDESKTLRMDTSTSGGYLTTTELDGMMIKAITEISPVRQVARVKSVSKKTLEIVVRKTIPTATYEGEAASGDDSESSYGNETLTAYRHTVTVPFTMDLLQDSEFDLESEIKSDVAEAFAFGEGRNFVLGDGSKKPEGFLLHPEVVAGAKVTAASGVISGDDLILLAGELKVGYSPLFGFNRQTLALLRTIKGSDRHYMWQAGLAPSAPNTIAGEPYVVMQDMPVVAANAFSVIYGDFARGYTITDRTGTVIVRDELSKKRQAIVEMTFHRWNTGQVVLPEAFIALKIKP